MKSDVISCIGPPSCIGAHLSKQLVVEKRIHNIQPFGFFFFLTHRNAIHILLLDSHILTAHIQAMSYVSGTNIIWTLSVSESEK